MWIGSFAKHIRKRVYNRERIVGARNQVLIAWVNSNRIYFAAVRADKIWYKFQIAGIHHEHTWHTARATVRSCAEKYRSRPVPLQLSDIIFVFVRAHCLGEVSNIVNAHTIIFRQKRKMRQVDIVIPSQSY